MWIAIPLLALQATATPWELKEIRRHEGATPDQALGFFVGSIRDVDADGTPDYLIGSPGQRPTPDGKRLGGAQLHSGATGKILRSWFGPHEGSHFGRIALGAGDFTGDGNPDVAVGATKDSRHAKEEGSLTLLDARSGERLHTWFGGEAFDKFGRCLAILPSPAKGGVSQLLVGGYQPSGLHRKGPGYLRVYSTEAGLLDTIEGNLPRDMFGVTVCNAGDLNQDGRDDFAVGSFFGRNLNSENQTSVGSVSVFEGTSRKLLWRKFATDFPFGADASRNSTFGRKVCGPGDLNGDGFADVLVSAPLWDAAGESDQDNRGLVIALSGKDGSQLPNGRMEGRRRGSGLGHAVSPMGDLDGDGVGDFLLGAMSGSYLELRSGADFRVLASPRVREERPCMPNPLAKPGIWTAMASQKYSWASPTEPWMG